MINMGRYKMYDDSNGRGNPEEWRNSFKDRAHWYHFAIEETTIEVEKNVSMVKCKTIDELQGVFRQRFLMCHPDIAGDTKENTKITQQLIALYEKLKTKL